MIKNKNLKMRSGVTLMELMMSMLISSILLLIVGVLIVSSAKGWQQNYDLAHKPILEQAAVASLTFASVGRMSNRSDYIVYNGTGSTFVPVISATPGQDTVVSGNAVEFRYWDVNLDTTDSQNLMDVSKTGTAYALFYLHNGKLKVDYGHYPPGGVPAGGGNKNNSNIRTVTLAENASAAPGCGAFSHTMVSGAGKGCVRINIVLTDPNDNKTIRISNSVLLRNKWPQ
ncbi:MAG: prepilin-type N-terminal cleavage/methylation domain-containing protein [Phycisphaerales bacterium]